MDFQVESYRWGVEHLGDSPEYDELEAALRGVSHSEVRRHQLASVQNWIDGNRRPPVGGQTALNAIIGKRLRALDWETEIPVVVDTTGKQVPYWSMDFRKGLIGVEVSFNNAGVLPQNLLRFSVLAESPMVAEGERIRLGVLVVANLALKTWSGMDSTVHTFEQVRRVLPYVNFSVPTPMIIVGLNPSEDGVKWPETDLFRRQRQLAIGRELKGKFANETVTEQAWWVRVAAEEAADLVDAPSVIAAEVAPSYE